MKLDCTFKAQVGSSFRKLGENLTKTLYCLKLCSKGRIQKSECVILCSYCRTTSALSVLENLSNRKQQQKTSFTCADLLC